MPNLRLADCLQRDGRESQSKRSDPDLTAPLGRLAVSDRLPGAAAGAEAGRALVDTMASAAEELLRQPDLSLAELDAIARRS